MNAQTTPSNDYEHGQMMGMLVLVRLLKTKGTVPAEMIDRIERRSSAGLSEYLQKPEEDVYLMVDNLVKTI